MSYKQIIIARKDLNMSPGKLASQVSHGSMAFLTKMIKDNTVKYYVNRYRSFEIDRDGNKSRMWYRHPDLFEMAEEAYSKGQNYFYAKKKYENRSYGPLIPDKPRYVYNTKFDVDNDLYEQWINGEFTKIILQAKNKNKLLKAVEIAKELGLKEGTDFFLIKDNCHTELEPEEFDENGQGRVLTCIGFKPMDFEIVDKIGKKFHVWMDKENS